MAYEHTGRLWMCMWANIFVDNNPPKILHKGNSQNIAPINTYCYTLCIISTTDNNLHIQYTLTWSQVLGSALDIITISEWQFLEALRAILWLYKVTTKLLIIVKYSYKMVHNNDIKLRSCDINPDEDVWAKLLSVCCMCVHVI